MTDSEKPEPRQALPEIFGKSIRVYNEQGELEVLGDCLLPPEQIEAELKRHKPAGSDPPKQALVELFADVPSPPGILADCFLPPEQIEAELKRHEQDKADEAKAKAKSHE